jgi:hypothetical protein
MADGPAWPHISASGDQRFLARPDKLELPPA